MAPLSAVRLTSCQCLNTRCIPTVQLTASQHADRENRIQEYVPPIVVSWSIIAKVPELFPFHCSIFMAFGSYIHTPLPLLPNLMPPTEHIALPQSTRLQHHAPQSQCTCGTEDGMHSFTHARTITLTGRRKTVLTG
jgi:hypothetical protein